MRRLSEPAARAQVFGPPGAAGGRGLRPDGVDRGVRACRQEPFAAARRRLRRGSAQGPGRGGLRSRERVEIAASSAPWRPCFRSGFCGQRPERGAELGLVAVEPERVDVDEAGEPPPLRQRAPDRTGERRHSSAGLARSQACIPSSTSPDSVRRMAACSSRCLSARSSISGSASILTTRARHQESGSESSSRLSCARSGWSETQKQPWPVQSRFSRTSTIRLVGPVRITNSPDSATNWPLSTRLAVRAPVNPMSSDGAGTSMAPSSRDLRHHSSQSS